jgi:mono/diheme cytochrome c family protein
LLLLRSGIALAVLTAALACSEAPEGAAGDSAVARGRTVYLSVCTACHHADPTQDGSVGPANAGASRELLEAKILRGSYPPGYTPKRDSAMMPPMPQLAGSLDDLAAFLAAAAREAP